MAMGRNRISSSGRVREAASQGRRMTMPQAPPVRYCSMSSAIASQRHADEEHVGPEVGAEELIGIEEAADDAEDQRRRADQQEARPPAAHLAGSDPAEWRRNVLCAAAGITSRLPW